MSGIDDIFGPFGSIFGASPSGAAVHAPPAPCVMCVRHAQVLAEAQTEAANALEKLRTTRARLAEARALAEADGTTMGFLEREKAELTEERDRVMRERNELRSELKTLTAHLITAETALRKIAMSDRRYPDGRDAIDCAEAALKGLPLLAPCLRYKVDGEHIFDDNGGPGSVPSCECGAERTTS